MPGSDSSIADECTYTWQHQIMMQYTSSVEAYDISTSTHTCWHKDKVKNCHCSDIFVCQYGMDMSKLLDSLDLVMKFTWQPFSYQVHTSHAMHMIIIVGHADMQ